VKRAVPGLKAIRAAPAERHVPTGFEQRLQLLAVWPNRTAGVVLLRVREALAFGVCMPSPSTYLQALELFPCHCAAHRIVAFNITQILGSDFA
jgi:hypothetical protein